MRAGAGPWRWPPALLAAVALLFALPFAVATIPPLTDVPGHLGRFAVQTAALGDPALGWFGFHWALILNLASDALVELLHPWLGVVGATRLLCAATPVLTAFGLLLVARALNARGAAALPWALLYVWSYPFVWGFLNYALVAGAALVATAGWIALRARPGWRAGLFLLVVPLLLIGHGVAGVLGVALIFAHEAAQVWPARGWRARAGAWGRAVWSPLVATLAMLVVWRLAGTPGEGPTLWLPYRKGEALVMALRDQNLALDVGAVVASLAVLLLGRRWGARFGRYGAAMTGAALLLFLATPSLLSGSDRLDTRLAPVVLMLALALQDWSAVAPARRRAVTGLGVALLLARLAVTTISFAGYDARYRAELAALNHVRPGARVLAFAPVACVQTAWRSERLEHLPALATLYRGAWTNAHWSLDGLQLLTVRYRPDPRFWRDPSQLTWPEVCVDRRLAPADQDRVTLAEAIRAAPLARVDYLWLVGQHLPPGTGARLRLVWRGPGELYETTRNE